MDTSTQDVRGQGADVYATVLGSESAAGGVGGSSKVILDTGASANLAGVSWLNNHDAILKALGRPQAKITLAFDSFRYGNGRVGDVHRAAIIPIAIVGHTGHFTAYVVDADIPALSGKEALETLGGHLNLCERVLTLESLGAGIPLEMSPAGHYLLNVVDFPESTGAGMSDARNGGNARRVVSNKGPVRNNAFSFMDVTPMTKMHPAGESGPPLTLSRWEMKQFEPVGLHPGGEISPPLRLDGFPPETHDVTHQAPPADEPVSKRNTLPIHNALTSTKLGDALDGAKSDSKEICHRLHVNWGHASAQQLKRTMAEADGKA